MSPELGASGMTEYLSREPHMSVNKKQKRQTPCKKQTRAKCRHCRYKGVPVPDWN